MKKVLLKIMVFFFTIATVSFLLPTGIHAASHMRTPINYLKSSETVPYPSSAVVHNPHFWMKVKISANRVYLMNGNHVVYTMYCTAGQYQNQNGKKVSMTPTGTFHIQPEKGNTFYNASVQSGGNYYRSFHNHGQYLFHSVPIDANGHYIPAERKKLGKSTGSHGCVRLSVADAKWVYQNVPVGTKVVVEN